MLIVTPSIWTIIINISQIIVIFKTTMVKLHPTFLSIHRFNINNDPVHSIAIIFLFSEIAECSKENLEFKKF